MSETTEASPGLDPAARYTFISYLPSEETSRGCHCHPEYTYHESAFAIEQRLTLASLVEFLVNEKLANHADATVLFFDERFPSQPDEYDEAEAYRLYEAHRGMLEATIEDLVNTSAPVVKAKREAAAKALAEQAAAAERIRIAKWKVEEQERRERAEYERLQKKFATSERK